VQQANKWSCSAALIEAWQRAPVAINNYDNTFQATVMAVTLAGCLCAAG